MIFATKLAKIGNAKKINCNQTSVQPLQFSVYLSNQGVSAKTLGYSQNKYSLSKINNTYNYSEVIGLNNNYIFASNGKYFSILLLKGNNGS